MPTKTITQPFRATAALLLIGSLLPCGVARAQTAPPAAPAPAPAAKPPEAEPPKPSVGEQCSAAYERSQTEKLAGHYVAATAAALECSQIQCSAAIVKECVRFYEALEADTPTLVFSARKYEGGELTDVRVEMDGQLATEQITGRPLAVDPGPHDFVFSHPQRGRIQIRETARVGDHARVIEVQFVDPNAKPVDKGAAAAPPTKLGPRKIPVLSYVLGGVGVAALGAFTYFRVAGVKDYNQLNSNCSPECNPDDVDPIRKKFTLSYVSLGVGIASLAGAGLVYVVAPRRDTVPALQASVTAHGGGAMAGVKATF
jgi:hypothetical protein